MSKTYDFEHQLAIGEAFERRLDQHFDRWFAITKATHAEQRAGIDRHFRHRVTDKSYRVEYKADQQAGSTGNAFIETTSVDRTGRAGWAVASQADVLIYMVTEPETIYAIRLVRLRQALATWQKTCRRVSAQNDGYRTWGYLVPLGELERIAIEVH